ncbi:MAG: hypothetical protein HYW69_01350, partial [Candidatus Nealsonbacteria bacterium]|nr:hypothetical protein [Candidatus Nealsonbacteria bacterium]
MGIKKAIGLAGFYLLADAIKGRFVAGPSSEDAVKQAKLLKQRGEKSVINILGEHAKNHSEAIEFSCQTIKLIRTLAKEGLTDVNVAIKPSQLGLDVAEYLYLKNIFNILEEAQIYLPGAFVEIDAEDHSYREQALRIAFNCQSFPNQRLACQVNRRDAYKELVEIVEAGIPVRLCKGNAYPGDIVGNKELRKVFLEMVIYLIEKGKNPAFATHDLYILNFIANNFYHKSDKFELELLMGIEKNLSRKAEFRE